MPQVTALQREDFLSLGARSEGYLSAQSLELHVASTLNLCYRDAENCSENGGKVAGLTFRRAHQLNQNACWENKIFYGNDMCSY